MTRIVCGAGFLAVAMLASSAAAQQPARMVVAVGSNMSHVPSFVGVENRLGSSTAWRT